MRATEPTTGDVLLATGPAEGVSVVIPAYNAERWLGRAIDSVLAQSQPVAEVIVVDDGSTDGTGRVAGGYGIQVRCLWQANAGVAAARNRGIAETGGEWIAFLDADDEWLPHKIQSQLAILRRNPSMKWCNCNPRCIGRERQFDGPIPPSLRPELNRDAGVSYFPASLAGLRIQTPGFVVHRSVLAEVGPFDTSLRVAEDRDLWWRIAMRYPRLGYCPRVCYRVHEETPGSLTKGGANRSMELMHLCEMIERAGRQCPGRALPEGMYELAHKLAMGYLRRSAGRSVKVEPAVIQWAWKCFAPGLRERAILTLLTCLPRPVARTLSARIGS